MVNYPLYVVEAETILKEKVPIPETCTFAFPRIIWHVIPATSEPNMVENTNTAEICQEINGYGITIHCGIYIF